MSQTVTDDKLTLEKIFHKRNEAKDLLSGVIEGDVFAFLTESFAQQCVDDLEGLLQHFAELEARLVGTTGQPVMRVIEYEMIYEIEIGILKSENPRYKKKIDLDGLPEATVSLKVNPVGAFHVFKYRPGYRNIQTSGPDFFDRQWIKGNTMVLEHKSFDKAEGRDTLGDLEFSDEWIRYGDLLVGIDEIAAYVELHPSTRDLVIETLATVGKNASSVTPQVGEGRSIS